MATTFKNLLSTDIATTRTLLHEALPITGTIVSGTYGDENIKEYSHGMFQSVYDYPYQSSSANRIFDLTYGYASDLSGANPMNAKKMNIYSEMSLVLNGTNLEGNIPVFDRDGNLATSASTDRMNACIFICYARLLTKDEIKKGSYTFSYIDGSLGLKTLGDYGAASDYRITSPAGEFGLLYTSSVAPYGDSVGHIYYQAGIAVITASNDIWPNAIQSAWIDTDHITGACNDVRNMWVDNNFNNTTELNSTIYFCRADSGDFNYSSNLTYLSQSQIIVKAGDPNNNSMAYITTIGLYSADNELLATAKLSEPIQKDPTNSLTFRVRLDY